VAHQYQGEIDLSCENNSHTQLIKLTGQNKTVLEIGPATGYVTRVLKERGCSVTGVEYSPEMARHASLYCDRIITGDIEQIDFDKTFVQDRFDTILFGDVLEHLKDPQAILHQVRGILRPKGYVVASIPNVAHGSVRFSLLRGMFPYSDEGILDRTHLRFFTYQTLIEMFDQAGFCITKIIRVTMNPFVDPGSKQNHHPNDFPKTTVALVLGDKESFTYQFVVQAYAKDSIQTIEAPIEETFGDFQQQFGVPYSFRWKWKRRIRRYKNSFVKRFSFWS
jgi:2-polyprenyl-3-methyl-5-hydroxy-6-metoxy-1,4-benzoquinol methylase